MILKIQTSISGYKDKPCTLFSAYDDESRILIISVQANEYWNKRKDDCLVISNDREMPKDRSFSEKEFRDAIHAYCALQNGLAEDGKSNRLVIGERATRANPESAIQADGMDERGTKFRVHEDITNAQVAALATCLCAYRASSIEDSVRMTEDIFDVLNGHEILMTI